MSGKRFIYLICCSAACLGLTLTACDDGDDPGNGDTTTDTTTPDTMDDTGTTDTSMPDTSVETDTNVETDTTETDTAMPDACETEASCALMDQVLADDNCTCTDPVVTPGQCTAAQKDGTEECDPAVAQLASNTCFDQDGDGTATCFQACETTDNCDEGTICTENGLCLPGDCTSFFGTECEAGNKCVPVGNGAFFCTPNGTTAEGLDCMAHTDCDNGLLCVGTCEAPTCAPLSNDPACAAGEQCSGYSIGDEPIDVGQCVQLCNPFVRDGAGATTDTCGTAGDGEYCMPLEDRDATGAINGLCSPDAGGTVAAGGTCDGTSPATSCSQPDGGGADPLICVGSTCEIICDPEDQTTCPVDGQSCFPITLQFTDGSTFDPDWGLCDTTCTPTWDPDDAGTECEAGEYCWPDFDVADVGRCFTENTGTARDGESCDVETRDGCDDLHLCFTSETDPVTMEPTAAQCSLLCDPTAAAGEAGSCSAGANGQQRTCLALTVDDGMGGGIDLPVGTCNDTCDVEDLANAGCTPDDDGNPRYCQVGALFGIFTADLCTGGPATPLALNDDCTAAGLEEFAFCKDNGFCLDLDNAGPEPITCNEVCAPAGGPADECSVDMASCNGIFQTMDFGICQL